MLRKADWASIVSRPTQSEIEKLGKILRNKIANNGNKMPNICMSVYKNRGGKFNNIKIWLKIDYDTMRVHDMFVTDYEYHICPIEKTAVTIDEDGTVKPVQYKDSYKAYLEELQEEARKYDEAHPNDPTSQDKTLIDGETFEKIEERIIAISNTEHSVLLDEVEKQTTFDILSQGPAYEGNPYVNLDVMDDIDYDNLD